MEASPAVPSLRDSFYAATNQ